MRRIICAALLVAATLIPLHAAADQRSEDWRWDRCRFARSDGQQGWSTREVARTIECAVAHWEPVYGGLEKAKAVAACESGMEAAEYGNPPYMGVYQFHPDTWRSALANRQAFVDRWGLRPSAFNGRSNVLIASRIFANTWSPWTCA